MTQSGSSYVMAARIVLICISMRNILKPTRSIYDFRFTFLIIRFIIIRHVLMVICMAMCYVILIGAFFAL